MFGNIFVVLYESLRKILLLELCFKIAHELNKNNTNPDSLRKHAYSNI